MNNYEVSKLIMKILIASFGAAGIIEYLKNFIKTNKSWVYSLIMPVVAVGCYCASEYLPVSVIGSIMTIGCVQLNYQVIVQGFQKITKAMISKIDTNTNKSEEVKNNFGEQ